jgi:hypothetical protein
MLFLFAELALSDDMKVQFAQQKQQMDSVAVSESPLLVKEPSVNGNAESKSKLLHRVNSRREAIARRSVADSASTDKVAPDKSAPSDKETPDKKLAIPDGKPEEKSELKNDSGKR